MGLFDGIFNFAAQTEANEVNDERARKFHKDEMLWKQKEFDEAIRQRNEDRAWYLQDDALQYERYLENRTSEREYNDMASQVARLRAAGVNPALFLAHAGGSAASGVGAQFSGSSFGRGVNVPSSPMSPPPMLPAAQLNLGAGILDVINTALAVRQQANQDAITNSQVAAARQKMLLDQKESIERWIDRQHNYSESGSRRDLNKINAKLQEQLYRFNVSDRGLDVERKRAQNALMRVQAERESASARAEIMNAMSQRISAYAQSRHVDSLVRNLDALSENQEFWNGVQRICRKHIEHNALDRELVEDEANELRSLFIQNGIRAQDFKSKHDWTKYVDLFGEDALKAIATGGSFFASGASFWRAVR